MSMRDIKLDFRNGCNKLMGKEALIVEYNNVVMSIANYSDSLEKSAIKTTLLDDLHALTEEYMVETKSGFSLVDNFNPYSIITTPKKLKQKIVFGKTIMEHYNIPMKQR